MSTLGKEAVHTRDRWFLIKGDLWAFSGVWAIRWGLSEQKK